MATNRPFGFIECRHLGGTNSPSTLLYSITAEGGRTSQFIKYKGAPAVLASGNHAAVASADSSDGVPILGIIRAVYSDSGGRPRPLTFSQPTAGPALAASAAGWIEVNVDPHQTYIAACDTTVAATHVGQYVGVTAGTANTAAGISGYMIKISTATNSASDTTPFQIIGLAPTDTELALTGSNQDVEVKIAHHAFATHNLGFNSR